MTVIKDNYLGSLDEVGEGTQLVVIDFWATWCGPCKRYSPVFQRLARDMRREHEDKPVAFLSVDVDRNQALARSYRVKAVPTTVIAAKEKGLFGAAKWKEKARFSGIVPYPKLAETVQGHVASV